MGFWPTSWANWSSSSSSSSNTGSSIQSSPSTTEQQQPIQVTLPNTTPKQPSTAITSPVSSDGLPTTQQLPPGVPPYATSPLTRSERTRKQLTLYFAGAIFLLLSTSIARRSSRKRQISTIPAYYTPNTRQSSMNFNGGLDAMEAFNIATLGVASVGMMVTGGTMFTLDVVNVEEMRTMLRNRYGLEGRKSEQEVEEELEEWIATILARKEKKEKSR